MAGTATNIVGTSVTGASGLLQWRLLSIATLTFVSSCASPDDVWNQPPREGPHKLREGQLVYLIGEEFHSTLDCKEVLTLMETYVKLDPRDKSRAERFMEVFVENIEFRNGRLYNERNIDLLKAIGPLYPCEKCIRR